MSQQTGIGPLELFPGGATATGPGTPIALPFPYSKFTLQTLVTGGPSGCTVNLEGSLDGANFAQLVQSTSTSGDMQFAVDKPVKYIRGNLTVLTGGTSPSVKAKACAV